jgi:hypothetical protein
LLIQFAAIAAGWFKRRRTRGWRDLTIINSSKDIKEDSIYLDYYDRTITLLWCDDEEEEE